MGVGKTRITSTFLEVLLSEDYKKKINENVIDVFENSLSFYFNFQDFSFNRPNYDSFHQAFYSFLYSKIMQILGIKRISFQKLKKKITFLPESAAHDFINDLRNLFVPNNEIEFKETLMTLKDVDDQEVHSDFMKVQNYVNARIKSSLKFIILSFDEVGYLSNWDLFNPSEQTILRNNFKNFLDPKNNEEQKKTLQQINIFYHIWRYYFQYLYSDFTGILVAGKSSYIPFVGVGHKFEGSFYNVSPKRGLIHINLNCLLVEDIKIIFTKLFKTERFQKLSLFFQGKPTEFDNLMILINYYSGGLGRIINIIALQFSYFTYEDCEKHFASKEMMDEFFTNFGKNSSDIKKLNPFAEMDKNFIKFYNSVMFYEAAHEMLKTKLQKNDLATSINALPISIPQGFTIEDVLLNFGIPYSETNGNIKIQLPEYFRSFYLEQIKENYRILDYILAFLNQHRSSLDDSKIFELLNF